MGAARLRHVGIRTNDIARTEEFYATVFGLQLLESDPSGASAVIGDGVMNVTIVPIVGETGARGPVVEGTEPIHLGFIVPDLLDTFRRCQAMGAPIVAGDVSSREALAAGALPERSFKVADPNSNIVDVVAAPGHWAGVTL
jgi:catechol 2,3-dioxygenase-like lactoylglutathione lyase family enzyme